jgi:hypothetical protein
MAEPKYQDVLLRAKARAFIGGRMIGPGEKGGDTFKFTGDELPEFAVLADTQAKDEAPKKPKADTKPDDAAAAVKAKAKGFSGQED